MAARVCVSIVGGDIESMVSLAERALSSGADLVELRLDYLKGFKVDSLSKKIDPFIKNVIVTLRPAYEGGLYYGNEKDRVAMLSSMIDAGPAYVDVELRSPYAGELVKRARMAGVASIISWHSFAGTPSLDYLKRIVADALSIGECAKVVTYASLIDDNAKMLSLYDGNVGGRLIAFCMGEKGILSRFLSVILGCPILYACLEGMPAAPGQPTLGFARTLLKLMPSSRSGIIGIDR